MHAWVNSTKCISPSLNKLNEWNNRPTHGEWYFTMWDIIIIIITSNPFELFLMFTSLHEKMWNGVKRSRFCPIYLYLQ